MSKVVIIIAIGALAGLCVWSIIKNAIAVVNEIKQRKGGKNANTDSNN